MTQTFQPGELVNVQLRGVRYVRHEPDGALTVQTNDPDEHLWALPPQAAVERVAPQAGDVWAAPQTSADVELRAARVAGLRAFADLLESRPDVPPPYGINGQVGFVGHEGLAEALPLAASLGVEFEALRDTGNEIQRWARSGKLDLGGDVTLTLYVHGLDAPAPADGPTEVVDDEPPGPVPLVDAEPAEAAGETVEDAEVTS